MSAASGAADAGADSVASVAACTGNPSRYHCASTGALHKDDTVSVAAARNAGMASGPDVAAPVAADAAAAAEDDGATRNTGLPTMRGRRVEARAPRNAAA